MNFNRRLENEQILGKKPEEKVVVVKTVPEDPTFNIGKNRSKGNSDLAWEKLKQQMAELPSSETITEPPLTPRQIALKKYLEQRDQKNLSERQAREN